MVRRQSVARFLASFREPAHDCQLATGAQPPSDAHRVDRVPQPLDGWKKVESQPELRTVGQKALPAAAHQALSSDVPLATADESVWLQEVSLRAPLREQSALQLEEPRWAMRPEPQQAPWEQQLEQPLMRLVPQQTEPQREQPVSQWGQLAARLVQPLAREVSLPH